MVVNHNKTRYCLFILVSFLALCLFILLIYNIYLLTHDNYLINQYINEHIIDSKLFTEYEIVKIVQSWVKSDISTKFIKAKKLVEKRRYGLWISDVLKYR
jgi:hypothetical protein